MNRSVLIGTDTNQQEMTWYWLQRFKELCPDIPVQLANFGTTSLFREDVIENCLVDEILHIDGGKDRKAWFKKPAAMMSSKSETTLWLDTDTEILSDISDIFDLAQDDKLGLVRDQYYCRVDRAQFNTGLVLFKGKPQLLRDWAETIEHSNMRGDQEVLHAYLSKSGQFDSHPNVYTLPDKYNYVRLEYEKVPDLNDLRVIHWTGPKGKRVIMEKLLNDDC